MFFFLLIVFAANKDYFIHFKKANHVDGQMQDLFFIFILGKHDLKKTAHLAA